MALRFTLPVRLAKDHVEILAVAVVEAVVQGAAQDRVKDIPDKMKGALHM